jgi:hypothetical protein
MKTFLCLATLLLLNLPTARADVWDGNDDQTSKPHDLTHGSEEAHDLAARPGPTADVDWSRVPQEAYSSYEVTVDGVTSQVLKIELARFDAAGSTLLQTALPPNVVGGTSRVLEWMNGSTSGFGMIRVQNAACEAACTADAAYRIRLADTTIAVPRFNNSGTQVTILLIQNTRTTARSATVYFWSSTGALLGTAPVTIPARGLAVLNTMTNVPSTSGSITIAHDAGYGGLAVKATALEPATGFSFDTAGVYRPR